MSDNTQLSHSDAIWREDRRLGVVNKLKGRLITTLGFSALDEIHLYPEEIVFLLHRRALRLSCNDQVIGVLEFYELLARCCPLRQAHVQVFVNLKEHGFVVQRYSEWARRRAIKERIRAINDFHQRRRSGHLKPHEPEPTKLPNMLPESDESEPTFVVWLPKYAAGFKKSDPRRTPDFRVAVFPSSDSVPSATELSELATVTPSIPLRCGVVDHADVLFFDFIDMPELPSI